jgi:hypothetical protein
MNPIVFGKSKLSPAGLGLSGIRPPALNETGEKENQMAKQTNERERCSECGEYNVHCTCNDLTADDCVEIANSLDDETLQEKIGGDGELLAAGLELSAAELETIRESITAKCERLRDGFYDDYAGECNRPRSTTGRWIAHMETIAAKLGAVHAR